MIIGVLSDTHIPTKAKALPSALLSAFEGVDHIIHAGDILNLDVIRQLEGLAPVSAVAGNVDPPETKDRFGEKAMLTFGALRIGVVHGHGKGSSTVSRAFAAFQNDTVNCIVFGHSHIPYHQYHGCILMFNPGSPTDKRRCSHFSFGIIELNDTINARHIYFK